MFRRLELSNFRSYASARIDLSPSVTIISGPNGSGKTNILEALYVLARGSSFRATDGELLQIGAPLWRLRAQANEGERTIGFDSQRALGRKQVTVDGSKKQRLTASQKIPLVLFEPNDLRLLDGSPSRRREFLDRLIGQLDPRYSVMLHKYERALKQRNNLLKRPEAGDDELFVWDMLLADLGMAIIADRQKYIQRVQTELTGTYRAIAQNSDTVEISYSQPDRPDMRQHLLDELHNNHARDRLYGFTGVGPHRHDVLFNFNTMPAMAIASRGETRSIVLALKLIEISLVTELLHTPPLLLLDDVFSELDSARRRALVAVGKNIQTVITTTDADISQEFGAGVTHITLPFSSQK